MKHRSLLAITAVATACATALSGSILPAAGAAPSPTHTLTAKVSNNAHVATEYHGGLGLRTITYTEGSSLEKDSELKVRVLVSRDYGSNIYSRQIGVGVTPTLLAAIDRNSARFTQYLTTRDIRANFPDDKLKTLKSSTRSWLEADHSVSKRNILETQARNVPFFDTKREFVYGLDSNWSSDNVGIGDEIIAGEFTFKLNRTVNRAEQRVGTFAYVPGGWIRNPRYGVNWLPRLSPVTIPEPARATAGEKPALTGPGGTGQETEQSTNGSTSTPSDADRKNEQNPQTNQGSQTNDAAGTAPPANSEQEASKMEESKSKEKLKSGADDQNTGHERDSQSSEAKTKGDGQTGEPDATKKVDSTEGGMTTDATKETDSEDGENSSTESGKPQAETKTDTRTEAGTESHPDSEGATSNGERSKNMTESTSEEEGLNNEATGSSKSGLWWKILLGILGALGLGGLLAGAFSFLQPRR